MIELVYKYIMLDQAGERVEKIYRKKQDLSQEEARSLIDIKKKLILKKNFTDKDLSQLANKLGLLLDSNISLLDSLAYLDKSESRDFYKITYRRLGEKLSQGKALSQGLKLLGVFPDNFINIIRVFEEDGNLAQGFYENYAYYRERASLKEKLISLLVYPSLMLVLLLASAWIFAKFVIPSFIDMYRDLGADLPGPSLKILSFFSFISRHRYFILLGLILLGLVIRKLSRREDFKLKLDRLKLKHSSLLSYSYGADMSKILSILIEGDMQLYPALEIYGSTVKNRYLGLVIKNCLAEIEKGANFIDYLIFEDILPDLMTDILAKGYIAGRMTQALDNSYLLCQEEFKLRLARKLELIEPVILLVMAGLVLLMATTILLPMANIIDVII